MIRTHTRLRFVLVFLSNPPMNDARLRENQEVTRTSPAARFHAEQMADEEIAAAAFGVFPPSPVVDSRNDK